MYARYHRFCQKSSSMPPTAKTFTDLADLFRKEGIVALSTPQNKAIGKQVMERIDQCRENPKKWIEPGRNAWDYKRDCVSDFLELKRVFEGDFERPLKAIYESHYKLSYGILKHSFREHGEPLLPVTNFGKVMRARAAVLVSYSYQTTFQRKTALFKTLKGVISVSCLKKPESFRGGQSMRPFSSLIGWPSGN